MSYPKHFVWGAAAAAYQIEGGWDADGRGPSIWDSFSQEPGNVFEDHNGNLACDHYHRWREDVGLMRGLGIGAYRMSLSWPRILPEGTGKPNAKGIAFYDRLIDALLKAGITPWVTLFHWDLPTALMRKGSFFNRDFVEWFGEYAELVADKLGDRVRHWMTFNEPPVIIGLGFQEGKFAPGLKLPFADCLLGAHHVLMAHGSAVQALRRGCRGKVKIGIAHTSRERIPATMNAADIEAARRDYFSSERRTLWNLSWWADPIFFGKYPEDGIEAFGGDMPSFTSADMKLISQKIDLQCYNCYTGWLVRAGRDGSTEVVPEGWGTGNARGSLSWLHVAPDAAYWAARFQTERYKLPLVFSENGFCNTDFVHLDGKVHDSQRIDFLHRYLRAIKRAIDEGYPVDGYFYWSILDNFEWIEGYKDRFGLIHVDYQTLKRTPKDSYFWYRDTIATNGNQL